MASATDGAARSRVHVEMSRFATCPAGGCPGSFALTT
jgi:hypothetical protein